MIVRIPHGIWWADLDISKEYTIEEFNGALYFSSLIKGTFINNNVKENYFKYISGWTTNLSEKQVYKLINSKLFEEQFKKKLNE